MIKDLLKKARWTLRSMYGTPMTFALPQGLRVRLLAEGQIPELLYGYDFEHRELDLVIRFLRPGMNMIDVGANVGLYSIVASHCVQPEGRIVAFEPSQESFSRLRKNLVLNEAQGVTTVKVALADHAGNQGALKRDPRHKDGDRYLDSTAAPSRQAHLPNGDLELVESTTLDDWLQKSSFAGTQFQFWKMDIEGGELAAFRGAQRTLVEQKDLVLMFECTERACRRYKHTQKEVYEFLRSLGYHIAAWDPFTRTWKTKDQELIGVDNVWASRDLRRLPSEQPAATRSAKLKP